MHKIVGLHRISVPGPTGFLYLRRLLLTLLSAGLMLALMYAASMPASAQQYLYRGRDATYPNIQMDLYLTATGGGVFDATGSIYLGSSFRYQVKGTYTGGTLTATVAFNLPFSGTAQRSQITGTLSGGTLGTGPLSVTTGSVLVSGKYYSLSFLLTPVSGSAPTSPVRPSPPAAPSPTVPSDFRGSTGFGYTRVDLALHFQPNGGVYTISGTITVRSLQPQVQTTVMQVSGTYNPVSGLPRFIVTGAPPGNNPVFAASFKSPTYLTGRLAGIPSLGITALYINATAVGLGLAPAGPSPAGPAPAGPPVQVPLDFRGSTGFGYTRVDLALHFQPSGGVYTVSGQFTVRSLQPQVQTTILPVSGTYNPASGQSQFAVTGAPAGNSPVFAASLRTPTLLTGRLSGIPSLGITVLFINAGSK